MEDGKRTPWPLALASLCMDMHTGHIKHFPEPGGGMNQDDFLMSMMRIAWRIWHIVEFKPANGLSASNADKELLAWASKHGN